MKVKLILSDMCDGQPAGTEIETEAERVAVYQELKVVRSIVNQSAYDAWLKQLKEPIQNDKQQKKDA